MILKGTIIIDTESDTVSFTAEDRQIQDRIERWYEGKINRMYRSGRSSVGADIINAIAKLST